MKKDIFQYESMILENNDLLHRISEAKHGDSCCNFIDYQ